MQILEEGRLTDGHGRTVDFRNTVIIMTSNIGTRYASRGGGVLGFQVGASANEREQFVDDVSESLKRTFRPEFLNRIDEVIVFNALTRENVMAIVDLQMAEIEERLADQQIHVELTDAARAWLAEKGYDTTFGARPLRRVLQRYVESPLSQRLLAGSFTAGDVVVVDHDPQTDELTFTAREGAVLNLNQPAMSET